MDKRPARPPEAVCNSTDAVWCEGTARTCICVVHSMKPQHVWGVHEAGLTSSCVLLPVFPHSRLAVFMWVST